jgi:hypothetical protein
LRFAGAFFFAAVFAFAFFTMLPSSPSLVAVSHQHLRES